ncbi:DUF1800 domain-containing protein [Flexithrix dorotheae]|uniref:DUF1800 domain-containing protein n=1 Tax=Flexithrix dorotheae TaxID=70993 RepID=UPI00035F6DA9|nr:DUF1800 domain-containing protein [Flexithrix dorotheae]
MADITPHNGTLDRKMAAHLLRRATFGPTKKEIDAFTGKTVDQAVNDLIVDQEIPLGPVDTTTGDPLVDPLNGKYKLDTGEEDSNATNYFLSWWMAQMFKSGTTLHEKMTFFMHAHFTTMKSKINESTALYYQNAFFRYYALGNFKTLCHKICFDNAMLRFLDGIQNVKGSPQENFGRELLELYSIGKGPQIDDGDYTTYTEEDVKAATRVLSGWDEDTTFQTLDVDTGYAIGKLKTNDDINTSRHDSEEKTFSAKFNNQVIAPLTQQGGNTSIENAQEELSNMIDMIFDPVLTNKAAAKFICTRLYRYFVYYKVTPEVETGIIDALADTFIANDYELKPVLAQLFKSKHFYDLDTTDNSSDNNIGAIIKSPLELVMGTLRFFQVTMPDPELEAASLEAIYEQVLKSMEDQGMELYEPFEVAGYPAYHQGPIYTRNWISASWLGYRYLFSDILVAGELDKENGVFGKLDIIEFVENPDNVTDPRNATQMVTELVEDLLPEEISEERFNYFLDAVLLDDLSAVNWEFEWDTYKSSGDDTAVRGQLEKLIKAILQSPEYQLS